MMLAEKLIDANDLQSKIRVVDKRSDEIILSDSVRKGVLPLLFQDDSIDCDN